MTDNDSLQRFIFENAPIRGEIIHLEETFKNIIALHPYPAPVRQLLGEALCVAGLLTAIIKFEGRLTVQFKGKGKLKLLLAQCNSRFDMRGLAKYDDEITYNDLIESFHEGVLVITLDSMLKSNPYQGIVSWRGNSLAESIEGYFRDSEQLATKLFLNVNDSSAAGLLLQIVPAMDRHQNHLEKEKINPEWERVITTAAQLNTQNLHQLDNEALLRKLYPHEQIRVFAPTPMQFQCPCTRKSGEDAILLLGREETEAELTSHQAVVVTCDFCNEEYLFDKIDVAEIFAGKDNPSTDIHLH